MSIIFLADLSQCELMQIPDAVYHLMRNTELQSCNLSGNVLKKVAPKFALKFSAITGKIPWNIFIQCTYYISPCSLRRSQPLTQSTVEAARRIHQSECVKQPEHLSQFIHSSTSSCLQAAQAVDSGRPAQCDFGWVVQRKVLLQEPHSQSISIHAHFSEIDTDDAISSDCLTVVDLRNNPISRHCRRKLENFETSFRLEISSQVDDDW